MVLLIHNWHGCSPLSYIGFDASGAKMADSQAFAASAIVGRHQLCSLQLIKIMPITCCASLESSLSVAASQMQLQRELRLLTVCKLG